MNDFIINYNHNNRMYKKTGIELYNNYCKKIIKQVYNLSQNQIDVFNKNTAIQVNEI